MYPAGPAAVLSHQIGTGGGDSRGLQAPAGTGEQGASCPPSLLPTYRAPACGPHLAAGAGLRHVVPHLDGPVGGHQQEAGIPAERQGGAGHSVDAWQLQEALWSVRRDQKSQTPPKRKSPSVRTATSKEQQVAQGHPPYGPCRHRAGVWREEITR